MGASALSRNGMGPREGMIPRREKQEAIGRRGQESPPVSSPSYLAPHTPETLSHSLWELVPQYHPTPTPWDLPVVTGVQVSHRSWGIELSMQLAGALSAGQAAGVVQKEAKGAGAAGGAIT